MPNMAALQTQYIWNKLIHFSYTIHRLTIKKIIHVFSNDQKLAQVAHVTVILFINNLQFLKAEAPLLFSLIYVGMSEIFKASF